MTALPTPSQTTRRLPLGVVGRVSVLLGALAGVMLASPRQLPWVAALAALLLLLTFRYPSLARLLHPRRLLFLALLALPPLFFLGARDRALGPLPYSSQGLTAALQITLRFVVALMAVEGFASTVEISELAGLFEALGLKGLGFSLGVAFNLLPALQESSRVTWQALRMRGGLRRQKRRAAVYLLTTIFASALRRAEEIALAAEARAFSPERARPWPLTLRPADKWAAAGVLAGLLLLLLGR